VGAEFHDRPTTGHAARFEPIRQIVQILREVSNADTGISVQAVECRDVFSDPSLMAAVWLRER
jgi:hypothetical protein